MSKQNKIVTYSYPSFSNGDTNLNSNECKKLPTQSCFAYNASLWSMNKKSKCMNKKCKVKQQQETHEFRTILQRSLGQFRVVLVSTVSQIIIICLAFIFHLI